MKVEGLRAEQDIVFVVNPWAMEVLPSIFGYVLGVGACQALIMTCVVPHGGPIQDYLCDYDLCGSSWWTNTRLPECLLYNKSCLCKLTLAVVCCTDSISIATTVLPFPLTVLLHSINSRETIFIWGLEFSWHLHVLICTVAFELYCSNVQNISHWEHSLDA